MSSSTENEIGLYFGSDIAYLDLVQDVSDRIARLTGLDEDAQYSVGLSVREAVTNAIQHGNRGDSSKKVELRFQLLADRLMITVRDEGEGIEESTLPDPLDPENLLKPGGRGIFFVRSFMDKVSFRAHPDGGQEIVMEKLRGSKTQGEENDD